MRPMSLLCWKGGSTSSGIEREGFEENTGSELATCLSEGLRDGRDFELTLKGGKKLDLEKTFRQNGIEPNSFVYARYTSPPFRD